MRKVLSIMLAIMIVASVAVVSINAAGSGAATVTLKGIKGDTVTKTYAVGDTITAYTYLNASQLNEGKIGSLNGTQTYTNAVLELADEYDPDEGDITDLDTMFPITKSATVASGHWTVTEEDPALGAVYYNASIASNKGFKFNADDCALIVTHYTVKAAGEAVIENTMTTLAVSDFSLTRIINAGVIIDNNFTAPVALSDPILPVPTGSTVSGAITSYLSDDDVTVTLTGVDNDFSASTTGKTEYSIADVPAGSYKLSVEKKNHVTRDYEITVSGDTTQDVKICPIGDANLNGTVQATDAMIAYRSASNQYTFTDDYAKKCADANGNGTVQATDAMLIYRQATGKHNLF